MKDHAAMTRNKPRDDLATAIHDLCEDTVASSNVTPVDLIEALITVLSWVVSITDAQFHESIRSGLTASIPKILAIGIEAQKHGNENAQ